MKTQGFIALRLARSFLFLTITAWASAVPAETLYPASSEVVPLNVVAGHCTLLLVEGLNTSTTLPPTTVDFFSEDTSRILVTESVTQEIYTDPLTSNKYYQSVITGIVSGVRHVLDALPEPVPVVVQASMGDWSAHWEDIAYYNVEDPLFTFNPGSPAVKVSDTIPISIRRSMERASTLGVTVYSANGSVLGVGDSAGVLYTNASVNLSFDANEPTKTFYASARALAQGVTSTNIVLSAVVGSYRTNLTVLVIRNGTLVLTPASQSTAAGDSLAMMVTRTTTTNNSALEVALSTDKPLTLSIPSSVVIPAGQQSVEFVGVGRVPGVATIHATAIGAEDNTNSYSTVLIGNPALSYSQNPVTNIVGGSRLITLTRPYNEAGGDMEISLVSLAPSYFSVEPSVTIMPAGYVSVTATVYGLSTGIGSLQASVGAFSTNLTVVIENPTLTFSPSTISNVVGDLSTVTVTRPSDENAVALTLTLSSLSPDVFSVDSDTVTIPAGEQSASFQVTGLSAGSGTLVAYSGAYSTNISVTIGAPSVGFLPSTLTNTVGDAKTVTLSRPLNEANADLNLSLSSLAPGVFSLSASSVSIPAGSISATVTVYGLTSGAGFLQARSGSYATNLSVTVNDPIFSFSPTPTMTNTVGDARLLTVSRSSGEVGADLSLSLSSLAPDVFSLSTGRVTILAGEINATVTVYGVSAGFGYIEARVGSYATNLAVQVNSPILSFTPTPLTSVVGDARTVTIARPLTEAGNSLSVSLASLSPGVFSLSSASVTIPAGSAGTTVTVYGVTSGSGYLEARVGTYATNLSVTINDATLSFLPNPLASAVGDAETLTISRPVGEAGSSLTISLSSLDPDLFSVDPESVTISAGEVSTEVTVYGLGEGTGILQANAGSYATNLSVVVANPVLTFTPNPLTNRVGETSTVTIRRPVSQSGSSLTIQLSTLSADHFTINASQVSIAEGQISTSFTVLGLLSGSGTINASVGSYSTNLEVVVPPTTLALSGPAAVRVGDSGWMTLTRGGDAISSKLTVDIGLGGTNGNLSAPETATIQAGQLSGTFSVTGLVTTTGVLVTASASGYPSASAMVPVIPTNPSLQYIVWRDTDASKTYNAGDVVTLTFNSSMDTGTVTTANLSLKELNASYAWINSPTGSWGAGTTIAVADPGTGSKYTITLAGAPILSGALAVDPSSSVTDVLGYPDTTVSPVYLPGAEADTNTNGIPDWWEETYFSCIDCVSANVDPDGDGLVNLWEYRLGANPLDAYSLDPADRVKDGDWDSDSDGLINRQEIDEYGTDPSAADTDDDAWTDGQELDASILKGDWWRGRKITSPTHSRSPLVQRSMVMTGVPVSIPDSDYLDRAEWMVDLWVLLTNSTSSGNLVLRRTDTGLTNFSLHVDNNVPTVSFQTPGGENHSVSGEAIPPNLWTHLTGQWNPAYKTLELEQNDVAFQAQILASVCAQGNGSAMIADNGLFGYLDKVVIRNPLPADVIFVLDRSASMEGDRLVALKEAAIMAVDLLPQDTPIGIVTFCDTATNLTQGFTTDKMKLKKLIRGLVAEGGTDYSLAMNVVTGLVKVSSTQDRHLELFISDGAPNEGLEPTDAQITEAASLGIVIDTIGYQIDDSTELQRLSQGTDGKYFDAPTTEDLDNAFDEILSGLFKTRYLFDDGGTTAEDFERPLNWSNALSGVTFATNTYVETMDIELGDTEPPQWWQALFFGVNGCDPLADFDKDNLNNLYEYYCDSNPRDDDTDGDGVLDGAEDYDGDGLQNQDEQSHNADPRLTDTDDDGYSDLTEKTNDTDAAYSLSPYLPRALRFGGTTNDYLTMPYGPRFQLMSWTLEAWVNPATGWGGDGLVICREPEAGETNFFLGLDGNLRPVAGFGSHRVTGSTAITNDSTTWTHLAATYDSMAQKLTLYVNATQVVIQTCSENPRASGIGPVVQRIGQSFNGMLDEVRIWNVSRSPESLASELHRTLSGNDPGLVAYYRFDDNTRWEPSPVLIGTSGNNITNGIHAVDPSVHPWAWGQVEDFATAYSKKDWTNRWKDAATINGNVTFTNVPGVTVQYPALRLILQPSLAVVSGARWSLNGGDWYTSGDVATLSDTNNLDVSIGYRSIDGWTEPALETVRLTNGITRTLVRYYQSNGTVQVYLEPVEARSDGAKWRLDGGTWQDSETIVSNVAPGEHLLDFKAIDGWQEPSLETITLSEGQSMTVTKFFTSARGSLVVTLEPSDARAAGAKWSVDDGGWQDSGVTNYLSPGSHSLSFQDITGWTTPETQQVTVIKGQTSVVSVTYQYGVRSVSGTIFNESLWNNRPPRSTPPGDGTGFGRIMVGVWLTTGEAYGTPLYQSVLATNMALPSYGASYVYAINYMSVQPSDTDVYGYQVRAWIDANGNGQYDVGEPASDAQSFIFDGSNVAGVNVTIEDDLDGDSLPEWWEIHWFGNIDQDGDSDSDEDGLSNLQEYNLANGASGLASLNPANFDTDADGMDDQWEVTYYEAGAGVNPTNDDAYGDVDGDGLCNIQEYNGMDGLPRIEQDMGQAWGIASTNASSSDALNPLDLDTDDDGLVDSFEATWYDVDNGVDPTNAVLSTNMARIVIVKTSGTTVTNTVTLAGADPDKDGLSNYREQCLLEEFREGGSNDIWSGGVDDLPVESTNGIRAFNPPLMLGATNSPTISGDLTALRNHAWTSPDTEDTDGDLLPDGWEVEYGLNPNSAEGDDGFWGDPDGDGLRNEQEYLGQDGDRSTNSPSVNGTGDETNPNEHNWRPNSTGPGPGVMRPAIAADYWYNYENPPTNGTLGAALPTASLGVDRGADTDDDGIPDDVEIQMEYLDLGVDPSPVHSMSPFIKRAALINNNAGIQIPDPEGSVSNYSPQLHKRDWTVETYVKLLATNMTGYLINNPGPMAGATSYCLSLTNNTPVIAFHTLGGMYYKVVGATLPTGKWIHIAGSWDHGNNSLALYIDGVFVQDTRIYEEALSGRLYGSMTPVMIGVSANGTFSNRLLMDEIRIWGVARSSEQIEGYRTELVPQDSSGLLAYYRFDDGGVTAEDFARKAKNGLLRSASDDYLYGDFGYALPTNHFSFITNDFAPVLGVDVRGADDTDGDGMPDDWEMVNHLNPLSTNDLDGAWGDADGDGLVNIYEFWSDTNPQDSDTDQNGVFDVNEDRDGDGVVNLTEQKLGSRPDMVDTDDDGLTDNEERGAGSNPADATDPSISRSAEFGGAPSDYLEVPISIDQRLGDWTLEAWVNPSNVAEGVGTIVRRVVQNLGSGTNAMNFILGVETNASGTLQAFAGYVLEDGSRYIIHGGYLPTGMWTYAAAVYNSADASLALYTNGSLAVSSNGLFSAPPINGKGGETFVRIGEDLRGRVDEVRLWNTTRSASDILANYSNTVSETQTNLVHYFRFDDSQAVTNSLPFGVFHQPHGAQDYTHNQDWMNQWKHAGQFHGQAGFYGMGAIQPPASLRILLLPASAVTAGAQWSLDGGEYNDSGDTLGNLSAGTHTLLFKSISGWTAPASETIVLSNGVAETITRTYLLNGSLTVNIEPVSVGTSAQWRVDSSGAWQSSGSTVSNLAPYTHTIEFKPVDGWLEPSLADVVIVGGATQTLTVTYTDSHGFLEVLLVPSNAVAAGARWSLDGGSWLNTGTNLVSVSSGSHLLSYQAISGWVAPSNETINVVALTTVRVYRVYSGSDTDQDGLLDDWELRWFGSLDYTASDDPDHDGLSNLEEFTAAQVYAALDTLSPANFDSDGDMMDDKWEYDRYLSGAGLNPCVNDAMLDADGDGLVNVQEYNGMDGQPRLMQDSQAGSGVAASNEVSADALNPLDYDTDDDALVDSFEAAWYNCSQVVNPLTTGVLYGADSDSDGMSCYREQCLLLEFREGGSNDLWSLGTNALPTANANGIYAFDPPLLLGATNSVTITGDLAALRGHEWTDPSNPDTDDDLLPDGWEVEFNLNPKVATGADGFYGDPDQDGFLNSQEYLGQDGNRSTNRPYVNGTGDETNPNQHNWRPVTTGPGPGNMRPVVDADYWYEHDVSPTNGTLGAALPTASLGFDRGRDTDDDGIPDNVEVQQEYSVSGIDPSPVHSMSPFIKRSALIKRSSGVEIPDPEGWPFNYSPLLHQRDWTIECCIKLLGTNLTGYLVDNPGPWGQDDISYRLSLSNNIPSVTFYTLGGYCYKVTGPSLPTNRWIHLAGVWSQSENSLSLYVDGVYFEAQRITEEAISSRMYASVTPPVIGESANGSFTNRLLMDEIRIWGVARTADEIEQYRQKLVPQNSIGLLAYYRFDDGGTTAEDFARKAQTGLLGADSTDYSFGDFGYALRTNGFAFVTNDYADILGVDSRGADDTDGDGMPDDWESVNQLYPLEVTTNDTTQVVVTNHSDDVATGDADGDGLQNIYEYWSDTNPHSPDTDQDGVLDINEDRDGDGLANILEQQLGSRPDRIDTDDDGLSDDVEHVNRTSPADATDPQIGRSMSFSGAADDYLEIPTRFSQRLSDWSLEAWVYPSNAVDGVGTILRRAVQKIGPTEYAINYEMGIESDGGGGLRLYAGYITPDGSNYLVRTMTNSIPAGTWTHVAATYHQGNSTLILYTNGNIACREDPLSSTNPLVLAMATNFFVAPPLNGKGGECFVRMGEHFAGQLDEVRVWSDMRDEEEIRQNLYTYFQPEVQGIIHNFSFDDSEANTNAFAFGQFHRPYGAQDAVYPKDWTNQWIHAALRRGRVQFATNSAVVPPPAIRIVLQPQGAVDAGAQWSVDGGEWRNSGDTVQGLDRINPAHTIFYKNVEEWTAPATETLSVSNGVTTVLTRTYIRRGSLTVFIKPPEAINAALAVDEDDYLWSIGNYGTGIVKNALIYHQSGETITNLDVGTYTIRFYPVTGWNAPASWNVDIAEGAHVIQIGEYTKVSASLSVDIEPQDAVDDGARWRVDSGPWVSDESVTNLDYGPHTVEFLPVTPWVTPASKTLSITNDMVIAITGVYTEVTGLYVEIDPSEAVTNGAGWRLYGETNYLSSGLLRPLAVGSYTVEFRPLAGWLSPGNQSVDVQTGKTSFVSVTYLKSETLFTNLVPFLDSPYGLALDSHRRLYIVDSGNHRVFAYDTQSGSLTNWGGPTNGTAAGQFYQPMSIAIDGADNVFVGDMHNNRVQRWNSVSSNWSVWVTGVNPWDLALDWQTNLYIAEYYSNRVLKITPSLVRSTFVSNGVADGLVRSPGGITVDASNRIVVADYPSNLGRIQRFGTNGLLIDRMGSAAFSEGSLGKPQGLSFGGSSSALFVADVESNCLVRRNADATWQTVISRGVVSEIGGIAWDAQGYLYVSDTGSNRILRISVPDLADIPPSIMSQTLGTNGMDITWWGGVGWYYTLQHSDVSPSGPWTDTPGCVDMRGVYRVMICRDTNSLVAPIRYYQLGYH